MNNNLNKLLKNIKPGESKTVNIDYANIDGQKVVVRISPELSADEIFERAVRPSNDNKVIPFRAKSREDSFEVIGQVNAPTFTKNSEKSKFTLVKEFITAILAKEKDKLSTPEQDLNYYIDEEGRKYEINEDGTRLYFDDSNPNLEYNYYLMTDEAGTTWEYIVLEGGVIGKFLNPERTVIEVDGIAYNLGLDGIDYDHPLDFPTRH